MYYKIKIGFILFFFLIAQICFGQAEKEAITKIATLQKLIKVAEIKKLDVNLEKMTVRTAEIFLKYANWDEHNIEKNTKAFSQVRIYKDKAAENAKDLPNFERSEVNLMLDKAIADANDLIAEKIKRKPTPLVDWSKVSIKGNQLIYNDKPVYLADYSWKPKTKELTEYYGNLDGFLLSPNQIINNKLDVNSKVISELKTKSNGNLGSIFMAHNNLPKWLAEQYPDIKYGGGKYTEYDIDNPITRQIQSNLLKATVPLIGTNQYAKLGYMLTNEPHWFTAKGVWATGSVSEITKSNFRNWLKEKHRNIAELNRLWQTNFASFEDVKITIPIDKNLQGQAIWYDWVTFNALRVTDWFTFLKAEIQKSDPKANIHIKLIPSMWSDNEKDHGLDFEELVKLSTVIGNDAGAIASYMWGPKEEWQDKYAFEFKDLSMPYDFFKSISPDKINFNSEVHYLSTTKFRDLYLKPEYARATYWLAYTSGMNIGQTWFWYRNEDGSLKDNKESTGYPGSLLQQPRILNEVTATVMDLNRYPNEIAALQNAKKPIRIYYSKTSAINKNNHMDDIYHLYESMNFDGTPLGFATPSIIQNQDNNNWATILIYKTPFVTTDEFDAVQKYINNGGTVIIDKESFKKNEYGEQLNKVLNADKGKLVIVNDMAEMKAKNIDILNLENQLPEINIIETNQLNAKGCNWKTIKTKEGRIILSLINMGKTDATLNISLKNETSGIICTDLLTGVIVSNKPVLKPNQVYFVSIIKK